jgi:hypothetical protein
MIAYYYYCTKTYFFFIFMPSKKVEKIDLLKQYNIIALKNGNINYMPGVFKTTDL